MKKEFIPLLIGGLVIILAGVFIVSKKTPETQTPTTMPKQTKKNTNKLSIDVNKSYEAIFHTSEGDITVDLTAKVTPVTADNFIKLANKHFYDNTIFHRVIEGFMIQGGDPKGDGTGGPDSYVVEPPAADTKYTRGTVAMAKKQFDPPGTSGSQFFIMQANNNLPPEYAVLGNVVSGMDVVDAIAEAPVTAGSSGEGSSPVNPVTLKSIDIVVK